MEGKRLYRSRTETMIAGVCGGLAEYFDMDPTLVRVLFVIFALLGGPGILVYLVLWLVTPEKPETTVEPAEPAVEPAEPAVEPVEPTEE